MGCDTAYTIPDTPAVAKRTPSELSSVLLAAWPADGRLLQWGEVLHLGARLGLGSLETATAVDYLEETGRLRVSINGFALVPTTGWSTS